MRLYSIRHTHSGKFFCSTNGLGEEYWSTSPHFWKTIDGVAANLRRIASEYFKETYDFSGLTFWRKSWRNFDPSKLELIEVVITDVALLGETRLSAQELLTTVDESLAP